MVLHSPERKRLERKWKVFFRSIAILCSIVGLVLQILIVVQSSNQRIDHRHFPYGYTHIWISPESFVFFGSSLLWCGAVLLTMRVNWRGLHPGALVAVDLILWMGLLSSALVELLVSFENTLSVAASGIEFGSCLLHFIVFVWACVDEHRRRQGKYQTSIEELAAAMVRQQMERQNYGNKGPYNIPPGMALVPIEMLAKLNEVPPTYNEQAAEH